MEAPPLIPTCDSQASVKAPAAAAHGGGKLPSLPGKGARQHTHTLRSLHELQEYVAGALETQQQQERELSKLRAQRREAERVLRREGGRCGSPDKHAAATPGSSATSGSARVHYQASEVADLPPRLRALFEDTKVLKEASRRYKQRAADAERHATQLEQSLHAAQAANTQLRSRLLEGEPGGEEAAAEAAQARQQVEALTKAAEKLQHAHQVLQVKLDTDGRLHRQALAAAHRDRQQLEQQIEQLQELCESKDRESRGHALAAKQAQRKLGEARAAAAKAVAGVNARVAEAAAATAARCKASTDAQVHLMLCVIRDDGGAGAAEAARQGQQHAHPLRSSNSTGNIWADDDAGASGGSGQASGGIASSSYSNGRLSREQAVLRLQAGARGFLARKQVALQRRQLEQSLVLVHVNGPAPEPGQVPVNESADGAPAAAAAGHSSSGGGSCLPLELPALPTPAGPSQPATLSAACASSPGADSTLAGLHQLVVRSRQRVSAVGGGGTADTQQARTVHAAGPQLRQAPRGVAAAAAGRVARAAAPAALDGSPSPGGAAARRTSGRTGAAARGPAQPVASAARTGAASWAAAGSHTGSGRPRQPREQPHPVRLHAPRARPDDTRA